MKTYISKDFESRQEAADKWAALKGKYKIQPQYSFRKRGKKTIVNFAFYPESDGEIKELEEISKMIPLSIRKVILK